MWESNGDPKKMDLSAIDISSSIISKVEMISKENSDYLLGGFVLSCIIGLFPCLVRLFHVDWDFFFLDSSNWYSVMKNTLLTLMSAMLGNNFWWRMVSVQSLITRISLSSVLFFLLAVAERTFKQRYLHAKLFCRLTSSRKACKSELPHFRLNKVRNIRTWLAVRSFLRRRGPQRSVDVIVSASFIIALVLVTFLSAQLLKDSGRLQSVYSLEVAVWCLALGIFLLRFMTLGSRINRKYRNLSVLITEQINLYLHMEQKPHKKEKLMLANNVLKLAADLLKELESPFKISGLSANPYLYNITKLVILSAFSGIISELLGFKLKLYKIKMSG